MVGEDHLVLRVLQGLFPPYVACGQNVNVRRYIHICTYICVYIYNHIHMLTLYLYMVVDCFEQFPEHRFMSVGSLG